MTTHQHGTWTQPGHTDFCAGDEVWGNFNVNEKNSNNTFTATFNLTAVDSAGVTHYEVGHQVMHIAFNASDPSTPAISFAKIRRR